MYRKNQNNGTKAKLKIALINQNNQLIKSDEMLRI